MLRTHFEPSPRGLVSVGIGDDAAVLRLPKGELVVSVDASRQGVHFDLTWLSVRQAANRSFHAAVSDLAAMGAEPLAAVCAIELPPATDRATFSAVGRGQALAAKHLGCPIVGGNVTVGTCIGFTTTVLGTVDRKPALRSGAKPGDEVWLSHEAGWAGLGLHLFQRNLVSPVRSGFRFAPSLGKWSRRAVRAFASPRAKMHESREWRRCVHSLIDTSDSLASEVRHLASASDVRIALDADLIMNAHPTVVKAAEALGLDPWRVVLLGGEDYALLGTGLAKLRPDGAIVIGRVEVGHGAVLSNGNKHQPLPSGYDHLST